MLSACRAVLDEDSPINSIKITSKVAFLCCLQIIIRILISMHTFFSYS